MNWKIKAIAQNIIDMLPPMLAYPLYSSVQRTLGSLKTFHADNPLIRSSAVVMSLKKCGADIVDKTILEVGTGSRLDLPIGLWLSGASKIITVDLNPLLKKDLVLRYINSIIRNRESIEHDCPDVIDVSKVRQRINTLTASGNDFDTIMTLMNIQYIAPADAVNLTYIGDRSVDVHVSSNVFEHIPPSTIEHICREAKRILKKEGLFVHKIDLGDHFAYSDDSITFVNFLQYTEEQWRGWVGNRFMYHNRLRAYEFCDLFARIGLEILSKEEDIDSASAAVLGNGFKVDARFAGHAPKELSVNTLNITGRFR